MNPYLTSNGHSQEKAYPSTHAGPCDAEMTQLILRLDDSLFRDGVIFFVTVLKFRKFPKTNGVDNEIKLITVLR